MPGWQAEDWGIPLWEAIERWTPKEVWQRYQEIMSEDIQFFIVPSRPNPVREEASRLRTHIDIVLREKLSRGELIASGLHLPLDPSSRRLDIPSELWSRLEFDFKQEEASGHGLRIAELRFRTASEPQFEQRRAAVEETKPVPRRSAGRPSIMPKIEAEMRRRADMGLIETSSLREAEALAGWAEQEFADAHVPRPKSIQKKLGRLYRELKATKRADK